MRRPDFIVIGAMKCATSTLHEQLARQPGVFMPTPKEPNFFSDDEQWNRGWEWYSSHFDEAPLDALCGECSTHYTKLPTHPHAVPRMGRCLGDRVKFIYLMRHPIDRLISQYIHEWTQRVIDAPIDDAIGLHPELISYSQYSMQLRPYLDVFGPERVLPVFFERLAESPHQELERIGEFIGCANPARWDDSIAEQNVSSQRMRQSAWRDALVNLPGLREVRRRMVPQSLRDRVKRLWMIGQRPKLSPDSVRRLKDVFDRDLHVLGGWLGVPLSCESFQTAVRARPPSWARVPETAGAA